MTNINQNETPIHEDPKYALVNILLDLLSGEEWQLEEFSKRLQKEISPSHPQQIGVLALYCARLKMPEELITVVCSRVNTRDGLDVPQSKLREYAAHYSASNQKGQ